MLSLLLSSSLYLLPSAQWSESRTVLWERDIHRRPFRSFSFILRVALLPFFLLLFPHITLYICTVDFSVRRTKEINVPRASIALVTLLFVYIPLLREDFVMRRAKAGLVCCLFLFTSVIQGLQHFYIIQASSIFGTPIFFHSS